MRTILPLRIVAISSNICFIIYGLAAHLFPILILHLALLPMNIWRAWQQIRTRSRMIEALVKSPNVEFLLPFMTSETFADNEVVFREGDAADRFYVVADGEVQIDDLAITITKGEIFGEIGMFSTEQERTATVRARGTARVTWIDRDTILRMYREHPEFSLTLTRLITSRLIENQNKLRQSLSNHQGNSD
jgi:CRP/FNR family transcriptional regulator, cyclic AMP receptor protein